ncbi:MAG: hypothetical protein AAGG50_09980 [Bacteroidota bacterium]
MDALLLVLLVLFVIAPVASIFAKTAAGIASRRASADLQARIEAAVAQATLSLEARVEELEGEVEHLHLELGTPPTERRLDDQLLEDDRVADATPSQRARKRTA